MIGRPRAATIAECTRDVPKAPSRRPTLAPSSPPELVLPPSEPEFTPGRQTRSYSVGILDHPSGLRPKSPVNEVIEELVLEEPAQDGSDKDDYFMLCEEEKKSSPRPTLLEFTSREYVPENPEFPASPILRNCLEQIQRMSFRLDPSTPSSPANG
jgi:hypothetical protein